MLKHILIFTVLAFSLANVMIPLEEAYSAKPLIIFDKPVYNPFATEKILIVDPESNKDKGQIESVQAVVYTKSNVGNIFEFVEVAPDAGVFQALIRLTPDNDEWAGDLVVQRDDELFVQFNSESGSSTNSVKIDFSTSLLMFDKVQYGILDTVKIFVLDLDANKLTSAIDTIEVMIWSTTDIKGLKVTLREVSTDIGVFTGIMSLTKEIVSSNPVLKVSNTDVITAKYTEKTLPPRSNPEEPPEINDMFAAALVGQKRIQTELRPPSEPEIVDLFGNPIKDAQLSQVMIIQDDVANVQDTNQKFVYIVLIKDKDGITISLSWLTGELPASSTFKAGQSWVPEQTGEYFIETFLWQSIDNPVPLAPPKTMSITITHPFE